MLGEALFYFDSVFIMLIANPVVFSMKLYLSCLHSLAAAAGLGRRIKSDGPPPQKV